MTAEPSPAILTLGVVLEGAVKKLSEERIDTPQLDARLLLEKASGFDHAGLISHMNDVADVGVAPTFTKLIERRLNGEPVHRILGYREFFGRRFNLNRASLVPRPDTEILVENVLEQFCDATQVLKILDVGTGSGAIAVTLAAELPNASVTATDIDADALEQAHENADTHRVVPRMQFLKSDMFENVVGKFDIIVSNPPYIIRNDLNKLQVEVRCHDPLRALDGGEDGLDFYRTILEDGREFLEPGGVLFLEIGAGQAQEINSIAQQNDFNCIEMASDLSGTIRVMKFVY